MNPEEMDAEDAALAELERVGRRARFADQLPADEQARITIIIGGGEPDADDAAQDGAEDEAQELATGAIEPAEMMPRRR